MFPRMDDSTMLKAMFYGEMKQGKRDWWAPKKRFKDQLKHQLSLAEIHYSGREKLAEDRDEWRAPF